MSRGFMLMALISPVIFEICSWQICNLNASRGRHHIHGPKTEANRRHQAGKSTNIDKKDINR